LKPAYGDTTSAHKFDPAYINLDMQESILDLQFADTTQHLLQGKFSAACETVIGTAKIILSSIGNNAGRFRDTVDTDDYGDYSIILPAQPYMIELLSIHLSDPQLQPLEETVFNYFSVDTVDLSWSDKQHNFVYRNAPVIKVSGWPEFGGGNVYNVPIMKQLDVYDLEIEVLDVWGTDSCHVTQGSVTITDDISDISSEPVTLELDSGFANYTCLPGLPNLLKGGDHPYQKLFSLEANVGEEKEVYDQWAVVTGSKPRTQTFTATTPEIPFLILRDPPGDQSFSYLSKDSTFSWSTVHSFQPSFSSTYWWDIRLGVVTGFGVGSPVNHVEHDFGVYGIFAGEISAGTDHNIQTSTMNSLTFSEQFSTSDNDLVVGEEGDVYLGATYVNLYALTDIVSYDWDLHSVVLDTSLAWEPDEIESVFSYTGSHIRNVLLPQLKELRQIEASGEKRMDLITKYENSINVWESILLKNDTLKAEAVFNDDFKYRNISFSAGAPYSASYTDVSSDFYSYDWSIFLETEVALGVGMVSFGVPVENGIIIKTGFRYQRIDQNQTDITVTTGFTLADDDPGDFFSTNIKTDPVFGTPVFELFGGTSSCPWEKNTQPRDGVQMMINTFQQNDISPDEQAPFILYLGNTSQSGEEREYYLSVIQSSNLDGAIIRVGGVVIEDYLRYTIPAGEQLNATLSVERGPIAYDYNNLKIKMYAPGDEEAIADTVKFSVHFISPCSEVNLLLPEDNWVLNSLDNDTMQVVINEYEADNEHLKALKFQYRRHGENWNTAFTYNKADLPPDYIIEYWNISHLPDGDYELRAVSNCGQKGVKYSKIAAGVIDRSSLLVFGSPQPADGVLNIGEDISISFSSDIDKAFLSAEKNVSLITADDSATVAVSIVSNENILIITPQVDLSSLESRELEVTVKGVKDINGNRQRQAETWTFTVNQNTLHWLSSSTSQTVYKGSVLSFNATLRNVSGQAQFFVLLSLPSWLSANPQNGSLPADGSQDIIFTISDQLNAGSYLDTVFVDVNDQGDEPLYVLVNVLNSPPEWQVTASAYQYSMSITARIKEDGGFSSDENDIVGAFAGDESRGIANVQYISDDTGYLAFITVYSNQQSDEIISFRSWDASLGAESGFIDETVLFKNNESYGTLENPLILVTSGRTQNIGLDQNWNWFSFNVEYSDMSVNHVLSKLQAVEGDLVKSQTAIAVYSEGIGWIGNLKTFEVGSAYQINLALKQNLRFAGSEVNYKQIPISLVAGWNWIGYLPQVNINLDEALQSFSSTDGDLIRSQNQFALYDASAGTWQGDLQYLESGEGYLLKTAKEGSFYYSAASLSETMAMSTSSITSVTEAGNLQPAKYETSMSFVGRIQTGVLPMQDTTLILTAHCGDSLRGKTTLNYYSEVDDYLVFMTVYGPNSSGDSLHFIVSDPATKLTTEIVGKISYSPHAIYGSLKSPHAFKIKDITAPSIEAAFHYSSEASLANQIRLFITSDEMLLKSPTVHISVPGESPFSRSSKVFDVANNIYVLDYTVDHYGENSFFITATDLSDNIAQQQMALNVQNIVLNKSASFSIDDDLSISVDGSVILQKGLLFTESTEKDSLFLPENLTMLSNIYSFKSSAKLSDNFHLSYKLDKIDINEDEKRKIGLYRWDDTESEWIYVCGQGDKMQLSTETKEFATYAVIYDKDMIPVPKEFALHHNYPNPFNPSTTIRFDLPENEKVLLTIYNILGQKVRTLINASYEAGYHKVLWDGRNKLGEKAASGIYIYRIKAGKNIKSQKMVLLK